MDNKKRKEHGDVAILLLNVAAETLAYKHTHPIATSSVVASLSKSQSRRIQLIHGGKYANFS